MQQMQYSGGGVGMKRQATWDALPDIDFFSSEHLVPTEALISKMKHQSLTVRSILIKYPVNNSSSSACPYQTPESRLWHLDWASHSNLGSFLLQYPWMTSSRHTWRSWARVAVACQQMLPLWRAHPSPAVCPFNFHTTAVLIILLLTVGNGGSPTVTFHLTM